MPALTPGIYNQAVVTAILDGVPQTGLADGDSIRVNFPTDNSTVTPPGVGSRRGSTSFALDQSGTVEIDYKTSSLSLDFPLQLYKKQKQGLATTFDMYVVDGSGRNYNLYGCSVQSIGTPTFGGKVEQLQTIIFAFELGEPGIF